jgi:hypothetical protein
MNSPRGLHDPDTTLGGEFMFGDDTLAHGRLLLSREQLMLQLTELIRTGEGCEKVSVLEVTKLDEPDKDGCNWASSVVLDAAGVDPVVYGLAYAQAIVTARESWNLQ